MSDKLREEGNECFKSAKQYGIIPLIRDGRLQKAVSLYYNAYNTAVTQEQRCSAAKNLGVTNQKLAQFAQTREPAHQMHYEMETVFYFSKAKIEEGCKDEAWRENFNKIYHGFLIDLAQRYEGLIDKETIVNKMDTRDAFRAQYLMDIAELCQRCSGAQHDCESDPKLTDIVLGEESTSRYYETEAISYYSKAKMEGYHKDEDWRNNLQEMYSEYLDMLLETFEGCVEELEKIVYKMERDDHHRATCFMKIGRLYFQKGVKAMENDEVSGALSVFKECYMPIEECIRLTNETEDNDCEICVLKEEVHLQKCVALSMQDRLTGDALLRTVLLDLEHLNMDLVYEVVDWYRSAIIIARDIEVEQEAIALSRLGVLFHKVLKFETRANDCMTKCKQLADSLHPRTFDTEEWYKDCVETLDAIDLDGTKRLEKKKKILEELKDDLAKLKEFECLKPDDCIEKLFETFPPRNTSHTYEKVKDQETKKALKRTIFYYHPDKLIEHEMKYKVLCEEITKVLIKKLEEIN